MKSKRIALSRLALALALLPLLHVGHAQTATVTWVGPSGGSWFDAVNWSGGVRPTAGDGVLPGSSATSIRAIGFFGVAVASVPGSGTLSVSGGIALASGANAGGNQLPGSVHGH